MKLRWILVGIMLVVVGWWLGNVRSQVVYSSAVANTIQLSRMVAENQSSINMLQQRINLLEQQHIALSSSIANHAAIINNHSTIINSLNKVVEALVTMFERWQVNHVDL